MKDGKEKKEKKASRAVVIITKPATKKRLVLAGKILTAVLAESLAFVLAAVLFFAVLLPFGSLDRVSYDGPADGNPFSVGETEISAHRAGRFVAPENTFAAFEWCIEKVQSGEYDIDILEFDLQLTKDGRLVLLHDGTLDRTSNSREVFVRNAEVKNYTLSELRVLNMAENFEEDGVYPYRGLRGDAIPDNCRICTLSEVFDLVKASGLKFKFIIEIKDGGELGEQAADILVGTLEQYGYLNNTVIGTFQGNVTSYLDKTYGGKISRSASIAEVLDFYLAYSFNINLSKRDLKFSVLQIPTDVALVNFRHKSFVDYAHKYGLAVQYWTINTEKELQQCFLTGCDAIMTDFPDRANAVQEKLR